MDKREKNNLILGKFAMCLSIAMYTSYIAQIIANLHGDRGNLTQPLVATVNCIAWCIYSFRKKDKDYPVFIANFLGVPLGIVTVITSLQF